MPSLMLDGRLHSSVLHNVVVNHDSLTILPTIMILLIQKSHKSQYQGAHALGLDLAFNSIHLYRVRS
jgi:hypothetical protein